MHYRRWKLTGDPGGPAKGTDYGTCSVIGCSDKAGPTGACRRHWHKVNRPDRSRQRALKGYNITQEHYDEMLLKQGGRCKVCGTTEPGSNYTNFAIDHDHSCCPGVSNSCGQCIRGLLCSRCNTVLGAVDDDTDLLSSMIDYLAKAPTPIDHPDYQE